MFSSGLEFRIAQPVFREALGDLSHRRGTERILPLVTGIGKPARQCARHFVQLFSVGRIFSQVHELMRVTLEIVQFLRRTRPVGQRLRCCQFTILIHLPHGIQIMTGTAGLRREKSPHLPIAILVQRPVSHEVTDVVEALAHHRAHPIDGVGHLVLRGKHVLTVIVLREYIP